MRIHFLIIFITIIIMGCEERFTINSDPHKQELVVNSIINPNDSFVVNLSTSFPAGEGDFEYFDNASIDLFENESLIGRLEYIGNGNYGLSYFPLAGNEYKIIIDSQEFPQIIARQKVPELPPIDACIEENGLFVSTNLTIQDNAESNDYYWLYHLIISKGNQSNQTQIDTSLHAGLSTNIEFDRFNATFESDLGLYSFDLYLRLPDIGFNGNILNPTINRTNRNFYERILAYESDEHYQLNIMNVSEDYDRYLKSNTIKLLQDIYDSDFDPFRQTVKIHSNIENGVGIFGAYNQLVINLEESLCDE